MSYITHYLLPEIHTPMPKLTQKSLALFIVTRLFNPLTSHGPLTHAQERRLMPLDLIPLVELMLSPPILFQPFHLPGDIFKRPSKRNCKYMTLMMALAPLHTARAMQSLVTSLTRIMFSSCSLPSPVMTYLDSEEPTAPGKTREPSSQQPRIVWF